MYTVPGVAEPVGENEQMVERLNCTASAVGESASPSGSRIAVGSSAIVARWERGGRRAGRKMGPPLRGPRRAALAGRVEAGLRSLRGARLARGTDVGCERRGTGDDDVGAQALVRLIAEAFHLHDVGGLLKRAVLGSIVDDALRGLHAHARQQ